MSILPLLLAALSAISQEVVWINASDFDDGVTIQETGEYAVWVWSKGHRTALEKNIKVGENDLRFSPRVQKNKSFIWVNAGDFQFKKGTHAILAQEDIAMIAMSQNAKFDPERAIRDRRVMKLPVKVLDTRATEANHTDTVFSMPHYHSQHEWELYADGLRRRILLGSGLYPLPEETPLNSIISGRVIRDGYTVETVQFEAYPGFHVTGNLYRPTKPGKHPGIIMPHGHWENGRLENTERGSVPARAITMAKLGAVSFTYDMVGYNDSFQMEHKWSSNEEKIWGIHPFSLQLLAAIRALDFLESLHDVDPERLACTGASGGGTQTFAVTAVDERIRVAAPVNMISSTMQGGCICENAPALRLSNSNMEIGALTAPRPLLMVSASGDWTRETPRIEYPAVRSIYELYGYRDRVENVHIDAPHNYNKASREAMYRFFGKWLLGRDDMARFEEPSFTVEPFNALRVFPGQENEASGRQKDLVDSLISLRKSRINSRLQNFSRKELEPLKQSVADLTGAVIPSVNELSATRVSMEERGNHVVERWVLGRHSKGDAIPALFYRGVETHPQDTVLIAHGEGKAALANLDGDGPGDLIQSLLKSGKAVLSIDAFLTGEHHSPFARTQRKFQGSFLDTFEPTTTSLRVQDILTASSWIRSRRDLSGTIELSGIGDAGVWSILAATIDADYESVTVELDEEKLSGDEAWSSEFYIPGIRAIGDIQLAKAVIGSEKLTIRPIR